MGFSEAAGGNEAIDCTCLIGLYLFHWLCWRDCDGRLRVDGKIIGKFGMSSRGSRLSRVKRKYSPKRRVERDEGRDVFGGGGARVFCLF